MGDWYKSYTVWGRLHTNTTIFVQKLRISGKCKIVLMKNVLAFRIPNLLKNCSSSWTKEQFFSRVWTVFSIFWPCRPSYQRINRFFASSYEDEANTVNGSCCLKLFSRWRLRDMCKAGRRWVINLYVHLASFTPLSILHRNSTPHTLTDRVRKWTGYCQFLKKRGNEFRVS